MLSAMDLPSEASPQERYVFKPAYGSSHHWALSQLKDRVSGKRVLDIGAGGGGMGLALAPNSPAELVAIEIDPRAHPILRETYQEVHPSVDALKGRLFDVVLLLDVLEHLSDPFSFMRGIKDLLAPGALLIISVPNVAHWSVRFPLFFLGRFEYRSRGLLDRTHLFFFTGKRLISLCASINGCSIEARSSSIEPLELLLPDWVCGNPLFRGLARIRRWAAEVAPSLLAYQLLVMVRYDPKKGSCGPENGTSGQKHFGF